MRRLSLVLVALFIQSICVWADQPSMKKSAASLPILKAQDRACSCSCGPRSTVHEIPSSKSYEHYLHNIPTVPSVAKMVSANDGHDSQPVLPLKQETIFSSIK